MPASSSSTSARTCTRCRLSPTRPSGSRKPTEDSGTSRRRRPHMKPTAAVALLVLAIASAPRLVAQMRPGAKVEQTYGIGLPRDMDRLLIPDTEYPVYPLKPGQE